MLYRSIRSVPIALALSAASTALGDVTWTNPFGGAFSDGSNWNTGNPPGPNDSALFNLPANYAISVTTDNTLANMTYRQGHVSFNMPPHTVTVGVLFGSPANVVLGAQAGDDATVVINGGAAHIYGLHSHIDVGNAAGAHGALELRGGHNLDLYNGTATIGSGGTGSLLVTDGSSFTDSGDNSTLVVGAGSSITEDGISTISFRNLTTSGAINASGASLLAAEQWNISAGSQVTVSGPGTSLRWQNSITSAGTVRVDSGATASPFSPGSTVSISDLQVDGAGSSFTGPNFFGGASITGGAAFTPSSIGSPATTTSGATVAVSGAGSRATATGVYNSTVVISAGASASFRELDNSNVTVTGAASSLDGTALMLPDTGTHSSTLTLQSGAAVNVSQQVRISGGSRIDVLSGSHVTTQTLQIGNSAVAGQAIMNVSPLSTVNVASLFIGDGATGAGALVLNGAATASSGTLIAQNGILSGSGTLGGGLSNSGHLSPGTGPGLFTINGPYMQSSSGSLDIELGGLVAGSGYDALITSSSAMIDGQLNVTLLPGFTPSPGDTFNIIQAPQASGLFSGASLPTFGEGLSFNVVYSSTGVSLVAVPAPAPFAGLLLGLACVKRRRRS